MFHHKRGIFAALLMLTVVSLAFGQNLGSGEIYDALGISPEDCILVPNGGGYRLFIRKKPQIGSVLIAAADIAQDSIVEAYGYYTREYDPENPSNIVPGAWYIIADSTAAVHETLGEAYELYIPPILYRYDGFAGSGAADTWIPVSMERGLPVIIRTFNLPYINPRGGFRDNSFFLPQAGVVDIDDAEPRAEPAASADSAELSKPENLPESSGPVIQPPSPPATAFQSPSLPDPVIQPSSSPAAGPPLHSRLRLWTGVTLFKPGAEGSRDEFQLDLKKIDLEGGITYSQGLSGIFSLNLGIERDPLLMNRFIVRAAADWDIFGIEAGPYFGILNPTLDVISPGLSMVFRVNIFSGAITGSFRLDSSLGRTPRISGDYTQDAYEFGLGGIISRVTLNFSVSGRTKTSKISQSQNITSSWARYNLSAEYAFRPIPVTLGLNLGYQQLDWVNTAVFQSPPYHYPLVYAGLKGSYKIMPNMELYLNLEAPVYPLEYMSDNNAPALAQASLGFAWDIR
jgi:hypothetical protein